MNQRSGHLWSLLDCERGPSHLFVPVQGCKVSGRVSITPAHLARALKRQAAGEPRVSEGQIVVVFEGAAALHCRAGAGQSGVGVRSRVPLD